MKPAVHQRQSSSVLPSSSSSALQSVILFSFLIRFLRRQTLYVPSRYKYMLHPKDTCSQEPGPELHLIAQHIYTPYKPDSIIFLGQET